jgi:CHASE2 domain-containing sensor protein/tRNA A-37 threonylcarbamoyl transferase component Bud32
MKYLPIGMLEKVKKVLKQPVIISSAIATFLTWGIQKGQVLETLELRIYDHMMQMRPDPGPDKRLLIVAITEQDLKKWTWPLPGEVLDRLLGKLEDYQPRAIGLDIYRDLPVQPGHEKLLQHLQDSYIIVPICKHADGKNPAIAPPQGTTSEQVGFNDAVQDTDSSIRRNLISVGVDQSDSCKSPHSLSWQLALKYLAVGGIQPQSTPNKELQLRNVVLKPLQPDSGAYENADTRGYQILLNYRSHRQIAQQVTVTEVLSGQVKPDLVKDRIVLIGSTAPSLNDIVNTPFTTGKSDNTGKMTGVEIHAQMISQILSVVLNNERLFWFLPGWAEVIWIGGWSVVGGFLAWRIRHPLGLGLAEVTSMAVLFGTNFVIFTQAGWFPVISPALGLVLTAVGVLAYIAYNSEKEIINIKKLAEEREKLIAEAQRINQTVINPSNPIGQELGVNTVIKNRYKIIRSLGGGGCSNTYLAQDVQRPGNPQCVVKQMRPVSQDTEYLDILKRLFKNEADILEILGKNPQIPYLLAFFEENQQFYLVQEFIPGDSLAQELVPSVPRSRSQVINILQEVLQVMVFIHSYGVIHRDIKASNLMRRSTDAHIVLIDFGAVKQVQPQDQENQTIIVGTTPYAPPEQMDGRPQFNSDIFALGITSIQAFTGVHPKVFRRDATTGVVIIPITSETGEQIWQYWWKLGDTTQELYTIINKMVHTDYNERYQSAEEVLKIVQDLSQIG